MGSYHIENYDRSLNDINIDDGIDDGIDESDHEANTDDEVSTDLGTTDDDKDNFNKSLAASETRTVQRLRVIFALVLVSCTILVGVGVYMYTSGAEQRAFEEAFVADADKVLEAIGSSLEKTMGAIDAYAVSLLSTARTLNQTWPFVYFPDFAIRTAKARTLSDSIYSGVFPLVTPETRLEWEAYSVANDAWVEESMQMQENDPNYYGPVFYNFTIKKEIHHDFYDIPYNSTRNLLPTWMASPVIPRWPA